MKTKEELSTLKNEVKALNKKLAELNEDELKEVCGGLEFGNNSIINFNSNNIESTNGEIYGGIIYNN